MNKPFYLRLLILDISKIVMYEFPYAYVKPNMEKKKKYLRRHRKRCWNKT